MNPTRLILLLVAGFFCIIPLTIPLARVMSRGQDPAGRGMIEGIVMIFFPAATALALGIPAVRTARKHKQDVHFIVRGAAWIILLFPALVIAGVIGLAVVEMLYGLFSR